VCACPEGAGAAACGKALEDPEDDLREIASRGSLKEPEECASPIKPVSSSVSKMR